ncbi:MAG TPA: hypothetical protein P5181_15585 [Dermatophilaceae bacterium]|nr:hypothetical protein [Dermatophilaceae bacterium]
MTERSAAVLLTYRYLRLATVVVVVMLAVALGAQYAAAGCWQTSISAYYFTSAHSAFVAALCAIGTCLIVYQGNTDTEDVVLNFAGYLAFVVAFVPTSREPICAGPGLPAAYDIAPGVRTTVLALVVTGVVAEALRIRFTRGTGRPPLSRWARLATVVGWTVIAVGIIAYAVAPQRFEDYGHTTAAVTMFVGIIVVIVLNALSAKAADQPAGYVAAYQGIAAVMAVTLVAIVAIRLALPQWVHVVIWVEVVLIAAFAAFWLVQTKELWEVIDRREVSPTPDPTGR